MNGPLNITPDALAQEAMTLQQKLSAGLQTLPEVEDVQYGATAKQEVWRDGKVVLYRFVGEQAPTAKVPLLIAYALVNRPYMVDLQADRSLVKGLLARGEDVYIIDWGYPDRSDRFLMLDDYINRFIDGAVDHLRAQLRRGRGQPARHLPGRRVLAVLCVAASAEGEEPDHHGHAGGFPHRRTTCCPTGPQNIDVDLFVDTLGNVPADLMNSSYLMLKPFRLHLQKYVGLVDILDDKPAIEDFLRMEKWIFDSPDLAGEAFRQFIKQFYQGNGFVNGGIEIDGEAVDLGNVDMPILNIFAEQDHLVPPDASRALQGLAGSARLHRTQFQGRPHRHLRFQPRPARGAGRDPRVAGQARALMGRSTIIGLLLLGIDAAGIGGTFGKGESRNRRADGCAVGIGLPFPAQRQLAWRDRGAHPSAAQIRLPAEEGQGRQPRSSSSSAPPAGAA